MAHGRFINFAAFKAQYDLEQTSFDGPWSSNSRKDELVGLFDDWEPEVRALIEVGDR